MTGRDPALQAKLRRMGRLDDEQDWMDDDKKGLKTMAKRKAKTKRANPTFAV